jgi:hypothetical protein
MGGDMFHSHQGIIKIVIAIVVYGVVLFVGDIVIKHLMSKLNYDQNPFKKTGKKNEEDYAKKQSSILGYIERFMFLTSFVAGLPQFVIAWLTFKTVVQWKRWGEENGRIFFNNFLIGNALNIIYSFMGFVVINWGVGTFTHSMRIISFIFWISILTIPYILTYIIYLTIGGFRQSISSISMDEVEVVSESTYVEVNSESSKISINKEKRNKKSG